MAIDAETILDGIHRVRELVRIIPGPVAEVIGEGLALTSDVVQIARDLSGADPVEILRRLRADLRGRVTGDWQRAIEG